MQAQKYVNFSYLCVLRTKFIFMKGKNFLIAASGIYPYVANSDTARLAYKLARAISSKGGQTRMFMPRFGTVNERKHQLHEVIRLSGVNIVVDDDDMPLIIKVASIPKERMQVYFIDNDELFKRKYIFKDENDAFFDDNDARLIFFTKGVVETVKKLKWRPDYMIVADWFATLLPLYINTYYKNEPLFHDVKTYVVLSDEILENPLKPGLKNKLEFDEIPEEFVKKLEKADVESLLKTALDLAEGVILRTNKLPDNIAQYIEEKNLKVLDVADIDLEENEAELKKRVMEAFQNEDEK